MKEALVAGKSQRPSQSFALALSEFGTGEGAQPRPEWLRSRTGQENVDQRSGVWKETRTSVVPPRVGSSTGGGGEGEGRDARDAAGRYDKDVKRPTFASANWSVRNIPSHRLVASFTTFEACLLLYPIV